jgi:mannose-1-phosphate guanylyltransferase/phosphomannomutase
MKAFIMAAGFGTRLEPLTLAIPKPMVPIINRPIMQHNLELLKNNGIVDICANIHYFPEQIENYFSDGKEFGVNLSYSFEEKLLGTAGGVKKMANSVGGVDSTFVVLSSDALTDIDLGKMISYHRRVKAAATIALYSVLDTSQFGVVCLNEAGVVTDFQEKPPAGKARSNLANTGIYIFEPEVLDMIPDRRFHDFGRELFPRLVSAKNKLFGFEMDEYWSDIGSVEQYLVANADALDGRVKTGLHSKPFSVDVRLGKDCKIAPSAKLYGPVMLGDRVEVSEHAEIFGPSVIGDKCVIGSGAKVKASVIWSESIIGEGSVIEESIIGGFVNIEGGVQIKAGSVVANRARISRGVYLGPASRLKPDSLA